MRLSLGERIFNLFNIIFMLIMMFVMLSPMLYVMTTSIMPQSVVIQHNHTLLLPIPKYITFDSYKYILGGQSKLIHSFFITIYLTVMGTALSLLFTVLMAYPLSKKSLGGRNAIMMYVFIIMLIGGGLIPTYLVVQATGLMNSLWAIIIPNLISPWNMILMRNFFSSIPESLIESAAIDGASEFTVLRKIIIPLSAPVIATISLFYAVGYWNDFFNPMIYLNRSDLWPMQLYLRQVLMDSSSALMSGAVSIQQIVKNPPAIEQLQMATIIMTTVPILLVYPFVQKYFVKGVMIGSVKG